MTCLSQFFSARPSVPSSPAPALKMAKFVRVAMLSGVALLGLATAAHADTLGLPGSNGGSNNNARGYYFTAPVSFTITGASVLDSSGTQYVEIVRVSSIQEYPDASTAYSVLDYSSAAAGTTISENISVSAGDIIGVLGWDTGCGCTRYGDDEFVSSIFGNSVTLHRFLTQQDLTSVSGIVYAEDGGGNIGRTELTYGPGGVAATPEPSTLTLLGTGAAGVFGAIRRRRQQA